MMWRSTKEGLGNLGMLTYKDNDYMKYMRYVVVLSLLFVWLFNKTYDSVLREDEANICNLLATKSSREILKVMYIDDYKATYERHKECLYNGVYQGCKLYK